MFQGDSADKFTRWGPEQRVSREQTRERGPPLALVESLTKITQHNTNGKAIDMYIDI